MKLTPGIIELHEQAAGYCLRRNEPDWTDADERELNDWLAADPVHREIYDNLSHTYCDLSDIRRPHLSSEIPPTTDTTENEADIVTAQPSSFTESSRATTAAHIPDSRRRVFASAVLASILFVTGGWYWWEGRFDYTFDIASGAGETRMVDLPDGSRIALNFDSTLQVRYDKQHREVVLNRGEAFFEVAADSTRPFTVDSGISRVKVTGTAFNVHAHPPMLTVKVLEGEVEVRADTNQNDNPVLLLRARQGVSIDSATGHSMPVTVNADAVGDWRTGRLIFQQTSLQEVAGELERYLGQPVQLQPGKHLADMTVSGIAMTADPLPFLQSLPHLLPVRVQQQSAGGWLISKR